MPDLIRIHWLSGPLFSQPLRSWIPDQVRHDEIGGKGWKLNLLLSTLSGPRHSTPQP